MPELPEVEVVRLFLESHLIGKKITKLEILTPKSFIARPEHVEGIEGQKIISTSRLGKQLSLYLQNGLILLFHLKMTGQIIVFSHFSFRSGSDFYQTTFASLFTGHAVLYSNSICDNSFSYFESPKFK